MNSPALPELEEMMRRAAVGEEPFTSPSVDPNEAREKSGDEMYGDDKRAMKKEAAERWTQTVSLSLDTSELQEKIVELSVKIGQSQERELWIKAALASVHAGHSMQAAGIRAGDLLKAYRATFGKGLDKPENSGSADIAAHRTPV
jgi:hypothetical protein